MKFNEEHLEELVWMKDGTPASFAHVTKVAHQFVEQKRWSFLNLLVVRDDLTEKLYGFWHEEPATEMQDDEYPFSSNQTDPEDEDMYVGFPVEAVQTVTYRKASS